MADSVIINKKEKITDAANILCSGMTNFDCYRFYLVQSNIPRQILISRCFRRAQKLTVYFDGRKRIFRSYI